MADSIAGCRQSKTLVRAAQIGLACLTRWVEAEKLRRCKLLNIEPDRSIILGVDPGSRKTGYGLVQCVGSSVSYVASGVIRIDTTLALPDRLQTIFASLTELIERDQPNEMAVESVFMSKSAGSALKLGQARGAAIVAATAQSVPVYEYEARKVKQSVVGTGAADKTQVQHMVKTLLKLPKTPQEDAADALAIALCHINTQKMMISVAQSRSFRRGRLV